MNDTKKERSNGGEHTKRRRRRQGGNDDNDEDDDAYHQAYARVRFHPIASTGRPGTPHCYFAESYAVEDMMSHDDIVEASKVVADVFQGEEEQERKQPSKPLHRQVVHKHANGLVIVTAGGPDWLSSYSSVMLIDALLASAKTLSSPADARLETVTEKADTETDNKKKNIRNMIVVESIDFQVQDAAVASQNAACKRKHQGKMLKQGKRQEVQREQEGVVRPHDVLALVKVQKKSSNSSNSSNMGDGSSHEETATTSTGSSGSSSSISIPLSCCVWGTILERNHVNLQKNPALLQRDPLLDGYLAVVLPTGPFPPPPPPSSSLR